MIVKIVSLYQSTLGPRIVLIDVVMSKPHGAEVVEGGVAKALTCFLTSACMVLKDQSQALVPSLPSLIRTMLRS